MQECIDRFHSELQTRSTAIKEVSNMFEAVQNKSLQSATEEALPVSVPKLITFNDELSVELLKEIPRLRKHMKAADTDLHTAKDWSVFDVLKFIAEWDFLEPLPVLSISL